MTREPIYSALYNLLAGVPGVITSSRRALAWSDVNVADMPAIFLNQKTESVQQVKGLPPKWLCSADIFLYIYEGDLTKTPAQKLNTLLDAVEKALVATPQGTPQTLGGLVDRCWIDTRIETDEGTLSHSGIAVAIIPISILVPQ